MENQPALALAYQRITEQVAAAQLGKHQELDWAEARAIVARVIGQQARQTSELLGVDLATGRKLLQG